jgi:cell wall-associated NlpC family hydrolase
MATPRCTSRRPLALVRRTAVVLAGVVGIGLAALPGTPSALAAPAPATSGDAATLMAARAHDLEKVTEAFDAARDELAAQETTARTAAAEVQRARGVQAAARQQVRGIARSAYTGQNGALKALLTSKDADDFIGQVSTLQSIAGHQTAVLDQAVAAGRTADQAQAKAAKAVAAARATYDAVAKQQTDLQAQVNSYQADFNRLSASERQAAVTAAETVDARASRDDRSAGGNGSTGSAGGAAAAPIPSGPVAAPSQAAATAVSTALAQRGKPYIWAAAGPGSFDCSGLMQYAYRAAGISLPHSSLAQSGMGKPVARNALQPGDLVFFYSPVSHVAMYIGNGNIVQAPTAGDVVKITPLSAMAGYNGARRLVG